MLWFQKYAIESLILWDLGISFDNSGFEIIGHVPTISREARKYCKFGMAHYGQFVSSCPKSSENTAKKW